MSDKLMQFKGTIYENGYGLIAKSIMKDNNISIGAKGLYSYLCSYAGNLNKSFPGRDLITYELNISKDTFTKYRNELVQYGYLTMTQVKENGKFKHNLYNIEITPCPKSSDTTLSDTESSDTRNKDTINNNLISNKDINNNSIEQANNLWSLYPSKIGKDKAIKKIPQHIKDYGFEQMKKTIERYKEYVENNRNTGFNIRYQNGSTFFNSGFKDYLDENYKPEVKPVVSRYDPI